MANSVRLSVNMNPETAALLKRLSEEEGTTVTEIVRRAVGTYAHFHDVQAKGGTITTQFEGERTDVRLI